MNRTPVLLAQLLAVLALTVAPAMAADDASLKKDLTAVIALQGLPCGEVVQAVVQADSDFAVTCKDTNKYRVYLNNGGRVIVEARK